MHRWRVYNTDAMVSQDICEGDVVFRSDQTSCNDFEIPRKRWALGWCYRCRYL